MGRGEGKQTLIFNQCLVFSEKHVWMVIYNLGHCIFFFRETIQDWDHKILQGKIPLFL